MKKSMRIEAIRSAYDGGGLACGPVPGSLNAEAKVVATDAKGNEETTYVLLSSYDSFFALFETEESILDKVMANDDDLQSFLTEDVEDLPELKRKIARSQFKKVYELLYALLDIPLTEVKDLHTDEIPCDED